VGAQRAVRQRGVDGQPVDPRAQRRVAAELGQAAEHADERLLRDLLGIARAHDAQGQREHAPLVAVVDGLAAARRAAADRLHQGGFVCARALDGSRGQPLDHGHSEHGRIGSFD
jgi:hypothetical protein